MSFLNAILKETDEDVGIHHATFHNLSEVHTYLDQRMTKPINKEPVDVVPGETYQYILDNEEKIRHCVKYLQNVYNDDGLLNHAEPADVASIFMRCVIVEDILDDDEMGNVNMEDEEVQQGNKE